MMNGSNGTQTVQRPPVPPGDIRGTPVGVTGATTGSAASGPVDVIVPGASVPSGTTSVTLEGTVRDSSGTPSPWSASKPLNLPPPPAAAPATASVSASAPPPASRGWSAGPVVAASGWEAGDPGRIYRVAYSPDGSRVSGSGTGSGGATGIPGWISDREGTGLPLIAPVAPDGSTPAVTVTPLPAAPAVSAVSSSGNAGGGGSWTGGGEDGAGALREMAPPSLEPTSVALPSETRGTVSVMKEPAADAATADAATPEPASDGNAPKGGSAEDSEAVAVPALDLELMEIPDSVRELTGSDGVEVFAETDRIRVVIPQERLFEPDATIWVSGGRTLAERVWEAVFAVFADRKMEVISCVPAGAAGMDSADAPGSDAAEAVAAAISVDGSADAGKITGEGGAAEEATKVAAAQSAEMVRAAVEGGHGSESQFQIRGSEVLASDVPRKPDDPPRNGSDLPVQPWIEIVIF